MQTKEASSRNLGRYSGYCFCFTPLFASIDSLISFSLLANDPLGHHLDRFHVKSAEGKRSEFVSAKKKKRACTKGEQRRLSEQNMDSSLNKLITQNPLNISILNFPLYLCHELKIIVLLLQVLRFLIWIREENVRCQTGWMLYRRMEISYCVLD